MKQTEELLKCQAENPAQSTVDDRDLPYILSMNQIALALSRIADALEETARLTVQYTPQSPQDTIRHDVPFREREDAKK